MTALNIIIILVAAFIGYIIGRVGDNYLNVWIGNPSSPHHWIYGFLLAIIGALFFSGNVESAIVFFGAGLFISDFKDFWDFKFWGPDSTKNKKFWHID